MIDEEEFKDFHENIDETKKQSILSNQKVIIESIIYVDDFNLIIYTTICPKTSLIFVSQSRKYSIKK